MDEPLVQEQPQVAPPDGGKGEKLYNNLINAGFTDKNLGTKNEFTQALQNPIKANKIYSGLRSAGFTESNLGSLKEFQTSFSPQQPVQLPQMGTIPDADALTQQSNIPFTPQYADAHQQAIQAAKEQKAVAQPKEKPQKEERGILDQVAQAMYLPAFNQGFNEIVTKPLAGATDFVSRTIGKVYKGISGEDAPDWLQKGTGLDKIVKYYDDAYQERDKPKNIVSDIAEGTVGTIPLVASLFTGEGEAALVTKAPQFISKATKLLGVTGAANAYKDATDNGVDYGTSLKEAAKGELKGNVQGLTIDAQMLVGNAFGKNVANILAEKGIKYGGKAGDAILNAIATGTVFGGTSAGSDLLQGKPLDTHEAMKQFGMGLMFEIPAVAKGLNERLQGKSINEDAARLATASTAVSNMNAESTLRTLMHTPADKLAEINDNVKQGHDELYANSIEQGAKAYETEDLGAKNNHYANQMLLKTQADVKLIADKVADPKQRDELVASIMQSEELPPEQKQELIDKIAVLTPKDEKAQPEPIVENGVPETPQEAVPEKVNEEPTNNLKTQNDEVTTKERGNEETDAQKGRQEENAVPAEEEVSNGAENAPLQKAVDAVTHGIVVPENIMGRDPSARFDFDMNTRDKQKAVRDIKKGNYETEPAKQMLSKLQEWDKNDEYPIIEGLGGNAKRTSYATGEEIKGHIEDAKASKLAELSPERIKEVNKPLAELGFTHKDFEDYENSRTADQSDIGRTTESVAGDVQQPETNENTGTAQTTSGESPQTTKTGGIENAIQEQSAGEVRVRNTPTVGEGVGRKDESKELTQQKEAESRPKGEVREVPEKKGQVADKAKVLADKIRALKSDRSKLHGGLEGVATVVYDGALETVATVIEKGGELADAIQAGIDHIRKAHPELDEKKVREALNKDLEGLGEPQTSESKDAETKAVYGTKNSVTEALRDGMGMPPVEIPKDRSEDASLNAWREGTRTPLDIIGDLLDTKTDIYDKSITPNDEPIMREYIKGLGEQGTELNKTKAHLEETGGSPEDIASVIQQLANHYDQMERALNASKVGGNIWHKYGAERQLAIDEKGLVLNSIERIRNIYGEDIPKEVKKELSELQAKYDNLLAKNAQIEEKLKATGAEQNFQKLKPKKTLFNTAKKSDTEFKKERADIVEQMKRDLKKSLGQLNASIPGIPQLNAIAPHVAKLVRSFAEQGVVKLDEAIDKVHDIVKDVVDGISKDDILDILAGRYSEKKPLSDLQKQLNDLRTQARNKAKIEELEKGIATETKRKGEASSEVKALQKQVQELKKTAPNEHVDLSIADIKTQIRTLQTQIDKGDFFKVPTVKRQWETNPEWVRNNKEKGDLNFRLRKLEREAMDSKKSKWMKFMDWDNRWGRRIIFFGANAVYTKLASAAVLGSFTHRLPEQALGYINARMFPHIAKNAPIEGMTNATAEGKFYKEFLNPVKFIKNTKDIFLTGETDLSKELGKQLPHNHIPVIDLFAADAHIMIKDPVKRATFEASLINHLNWYERNGVDPTHPLMLESARQAAFKRAEYEIFQDSDPNSNKIKRFFNELEKSGIIDRSKPDIWNKVQGNAKYTAAAIYHFMIPVNTVPVNILKRVGLGLKLPITYAKALAQNKALRDGILNMTNQEADAIMVQLKKGQIGAAYWTLGFILAGSAAGGLYNSFYSDKEREKGLDPESDYLHLLGSDIPKDVQHNVQMQALQMGATWGVTYNHYIDDKGESQLMSIFAASAATAGVAAKQHPVINTASNINEAMKSPHGNTKFVRDLKRRVGVNKATDVLKLMGYEIDDSEPEK